MREGEQKERAAEGGSGGGAERGAGRSGERGGAGSGAERGGAGRGKIVVTNEGLIEMYTWALQGTKRGT